MINWDPAAQTALSDEEVISKPQKGKLYYVRYEIVTNSGAFPRGRDDAAGNDHGGYGGRGAS